MSVPTWIARQSYLSTSMFMGSNTFGSWLVLGGTLARSHLKAAFTLVHLDTLDLLSLYVLWRRRRYGRDELIFSCRSPFK